MDRLLGWAVLRRAANLEFIQKTASNHKILDFDNLKSFKSGFLEVAENATNVMKGIDSHQPS